MTMMMTMMVVMMKGGRLLLVFWQCACPNLITDGDKERKGR